ncbi:MAG TPA: hypothetical protein VFB16_08865, partial [Bauldia sp.]|nr:hypothetical protein [Bauldia sp.]
WAPLLVVSIVQYFIARQQLTDAIAAVDSGNFLALAMSGAPQWQNLVAAVIAFVGGSIVAVALHRVVLFGERRPGTLVYFAFGKAELLFTILPLIIMVIFGIAAAAVMPVFYGAAAGGGGSVLLILSALVVLVFFIFISVRFSLLWPMIVVEERYMFRDAWELSQGNFWRLFAAFLLCVLPFVVVIVLVGLIFQGMLSVNSLEELSAALRRAADLLIVQSVINYVVTTLISGIAVAALSYAYKALRGYGPDDIVTQ